MGEEVKIVLLKIEVSSLRHDFNKNGFGSEELGQAVAQQ